MQRKTLLLTIAVAVATLFLATTGWADVPAPPVNQEIGFLDASIGDQNEATCRFCHNDSNPDIPSVPNRHHLLSGQPLPPGTLVPYPNPDNEGPDGNAYGCLSCHGANFTLERDCGVCHTASPHHRTQEATDRKCSACHGHVEDYDDGHYIPTYSPSLVTPATGLHGDGFYDQDAIGRTRPETENLGTGVLDFGEDTYPGTAGTPDTHASAANRLGLILGSTGTDNDIEVDHSGRYSDGNFNVVVVHQAGISPPTATWADDGSDYGKLTITFDSGVTTAGAMVVAINAARGTPAGNSLLGRLYGPEGEGTGMFDPEHYEDPGGLPLNSRGFGAGSCSYCHDASDETSIIPGIQDNHDNHHGIDLGIGTGSNVKAGTPANPNPGGEWSKCNICHDYTGRGGTYDENSGAGFALHIRICEECHGPTSLHNIQADSPQGPGTVAVGGEDAGYGHVGRDAGPGDSDCWGCHGFSTASAVPLAGPIVPTIYMADRTVVKGGKDTTVVLDGAAFTNTAGATHYESKVALTARDGSSVILTPDSVDEGTLTVTIPGDTAAGNYRLQAVKDDAASNPTVITVVPEVVITQATSTRKGTVVITGSGFSGYAAGSATAVTATAATGLGRNRSITTTEGKILSWTDTRIVASFSTVPTVVTVKSVFGTKSYAIRSANGRPTRR